ELRALHPARRGGRGPRGHPPARRSRPRRAPPLGAVLRAGRAHGRRGHARRAISRLARIRGRAGAGLGHLAGRARVAAALSPAVRRRSSPGRDASPASRRAKPPEVSLPTPAGEPHLLGFRFPRQPGSQTARGFASHGSWEAKPPRVSLPTAAGEPNLQGFSFPRQLGSQTARGFASHGSRPAKPPVVWLPTPAGELNRGGLSSPCSEGSWPAGDLGSAECGRNLFPAACTSPRFSRKLPEPQHLAG